MDIRKLLLSLSAILSKSRHGDDTETTRRRHPPASFPVTYWKRGSIQHTAVTGNEVPYSILRKVAVIEGGHIFGFINFHRSLYRSGQAATSFKRADV